MTDKVKKKKKKLKDKVSSAVSNAIPFGVDDYIIVHHSGKNHLALAIGPKRALLEKGVESEDDTTVIELVAENVRANLGKKPPVGTVFQVFVEPYIRTIHIEDWGPLRIYRQGITKDERINLKAGFKKAFKIFQDNKATGFIESLSHIELRSKQGKWAGTFKKNRSKNEGEKVDVITINNIPLDDVKYIVYVLVHEGCHGVWFRQVHRDIQAKWMGLYAKRITVQTFDDKRMSKLLRAVKAYDGSVSDYMKEMADEDESVILKEVISYIKKVHKLDRFDLDLLHDSGNKDKLDNLWPQITDIGTPTFDPTEYAMTNLKEFFAECMSNYLIGTKLSKDIVKACEKTLASLKRTY